MTDTPPPSKISSSVSSKRRHIPLVIGALGLLTATAQVGRAYFQDSAHKQVAAKIDIRSDERWQSIREKLADVSITMREQNEDIVTLRVSVAELRATVRMLSYGQRHKARESIGKDEKQRVDADVRSVDADVRSARRDIKLKELVPPEQMPAPPEDMVQSAVKGLYDDDD